MSERSLIWSLLPHLPPRSKSTVCLPNLPFPRRGKLLSRESKVSKCSSLFLFIKCSDTGKMANLFPRCPVWDSFPLLSFSHLYPWSNSLPCLSLWSGLESHRIRVAICYSSAHFFLPNTVFSFATKSSVHLVSSLLNPDTTSPPCSLEIIVKR